MRTSLLLAALAGYLALSACSYTDADGVKRSQVTGGVLSDPTCIGFNTYGQGCARVADGSLQRTK